MALASILIVIAIVLLFIHNCLGRNSKNNFLRYKYFAKRHIMTKREEEFFKLLSSIFGDKCYIVPQVHLSAILNHKVKGQNWKGAFAHINGKSVDFVLLRRKDLSVLGAVEIDDSTHDSTKRT